MIHVPRTILRSSLQSPPKMARDLEMPTFLEVLFGLAASYVLRYQNCQVAGLSTATLGPQPLLGAGDLEVRI